MRQVHRKEVDLALHPGDLRQRLAKIHLRMARIVPQRHEYLAMSQPPRQHVVFYDGDPAGVAVLVAKPLEDPLRGMPLLLRSRVIRRQDRVNDPGKRVELWTRRRPAPPVPGRHRKRQHLRHCPRLDCIAAAAKAGLDELERLRRAEEISRSLGRTVRSRLPDAANAVLRASIVTARDLAATLDVSPQAALGLLRQLTEAGLVREATNQKSWRAFVLNS